MVLRLQQVFAILLAGLIPGVSNDRTVRRNSFPEQHKENRGLHRPHTAPCPTQNQQELTNKISSIKPEAE